jgi:hypothetical protein
MLHLTISVSRQERFLEVEIMLKLIVLLSYTSVSALPVFTEFSTFQDHLFSDTMRDCSSFFILLSVHETVSVSCAF